MKPLQRTPTNLDDMPVKDRIRWYQDRARSAGIELTWSKAKQLYREDQAAEMYKNETYTVLLHRGPAADSFVHVDELKGRCDYLSIRRNDREPAHSWTDFFTIKNWLTSPTREAIEIYPSVARLVDAAHQYHILVFPEGMILPFGFFNKENGA